MQIKLEKAVSHGLGFSTGYNYGRGFQDGFFNSDDQYARRYTLMDTLDSRHKLTAAPYWEIPVGKGRRYGSTLKRFCRRSWAAGLRVSCFSTAPAPSSTSETHRCV